MSYYATTNLIARYTKLATVLIMSLFNKLKDAALDRMGLQVKNDVQMPDPWQPVQQNPEPASEPRQTAGDYYNPQLEKLIDLALADGVLEENEKQVLFKKAEAMGVDLAEFEMVLNARLYEKSHTSARGGASPSSSKFGDIKKCPACGAMIKSFTAICPECGFEFQNVGTNQGIERLFQMLNDIEARAKDESAPKSIGGAYAQMLGKSLNFYSGGDKITRQKVAVIQNFPVPNTKNDILEFLTLAVPQTKSTLFERNNDPNKRALVNAWKSKCEQIIMKAKFALKDDKETIEEIKFYAKELKIKM